MVERLKHIPYYGSLALLAYMPFHIFLSQWLSTFTGGLDAWKVAKDVVTMAVVLISVGLVLYTRAHRGTPYLKFVVISLCYLALHILLHFLNKDTTWQIAALATVYNNRLLWFLIIGMSAVLLTPKRISRSKITKFVLIVSTVTCLLALLQYVLPKDIMTHFGYTIERGVKPAFFIDDKSDLPRVMSTVRDPNSFGAFLIVPLTLLWAYLLDKGQRHKRMLLAGLLGLHGLALFLTFSRGAWAGAFLGLIVVTVLARRDVMRDWLRHFWPVAALVLALVFTGGYLLRDQYVVQNIIFHSDETTRAELDSNDLHLSFAQQGIEGIAEKPLGYGPGTAGIVSIQDSGRGLLTENYFVQIGHEVGLVGLAIFVWVLWLVAMLLARGAQSKLNIALLASFFGYLLIGMVAHVWTNEVVAVYWWLLAGVAMVSKSPKKARASVLS